MVSQKAKQRVEELQNYQRFILMNPRTGQLATQDFVNKYIVRGADGVPDWKHGKTRKNPPWAMCMRFQEAGKDAILHLQMAKGKPYLKVRCLDLRNGSERSKLATILVGYEHVSNHFDEDSDIGSEASECTLIGDEQGLEGVVLHWAMLGKPR